jgi:hypothetical protein
MPVRDMEFVWPANDRGIRVFFNRGANGIDGTLSTALGVAHDGGPAVLLTGDLALLHDSNGFLIAPRFKGSLTIVLINNHGGGIFEHLPVAQFGQIFEEFFATPQEVDFPRLCSAHGVTHVHVEDWAHFESLISPLPAPASASSSCAPTASGTRPGARTRLHPRAGWSNPRSSHDPQVETAGIFSDILYQKADGIAKITINRPRSGTPSGRRRSRR